MNIWSVIKKSAHRKNKTNRKPGMALKAKRQNINASKAILQM